MQQFPVDMTVMEKRKYLRVPMTAAAVVLRDNACLGRFWMVNLSVGGALIAGQIPVELGERVGLRLELGAHHSVRVSATVVRLGKGPINPTVGLAFDFDNLNDSVGQQSIANLVAGAMKDDPRSVLIVDDNVATRRELKFQVRCLGWSCVSVATPLEAIAALDGPHQFAYVLVGLGDAQTAHDLLRFLSESHPLLKRLTVTELESLRGVRTDQTPVPQRIPDRPWSTSALARALGI
jgi:CheY-like chemotaxis protein